MSPRKTPAQKIVCHCLQVTEQTVLEAIETRELKNVKDVCRFTQAGDGCTACHPVLEAYLRAKGRWDDCSSRGGGSGEKGYLASAPSIFSDR